MALRAVDAIRRSWCPLRGIRPPLQHAVPRRFATKYPGGEDLVDVDYTEGPGPEYTSQGGQVIRDYIRSQGRLIVGFGTFALTIAYYWFTRRKYMEDGLDNYVQIALEDQEDISRRNAIRASGWEPETFPAKPMDGCEFEGSVKGYIRRPMSDPVQPYHPPKKFNPGDRRAGNDFMKGKFNLKSNGPKDSALFDLITPLPVILDSDHYGLTDYNNFMSREKEKKLYEELEELQAKFATGAFITMDPDEYERRMEARKKFLPEHSEYIRHTITFTSGGRPVVFLGNKETVEMDPSAFPQIGVAGHRDEAGELWKKHVEAVLGNKPSESTSSAATSSKAPSAPTPTAAAPPPKPTPPPPPPVLPDHVTYVVIGAGTAAFSAVRAIKANDSKARVLMIGEEKRLPYMRPPLSKELWFGDVQKSSEELTFESWGGKTRSVYYEDESYYLKPSALKENEKEPGIALLTGHKVVSLDPKRQRVKLDTNQEVSYNRCLIATGGHPLSLPLFDKAPEAVQKNVTVFRNVEDFRHLEELTRDKKTIGIIGGGFLGSELACALAKRARTTGGRVIQIFPEKGNMGKILPKYLTEWTTKKVRNEGVEVLTNANVIGAKAHLDKVELSTSQGDKVLVDHVVVAVGLQPNTDLAQSAQLEVDPTIGGYRVNAELEARSNVWVAGDASSFYDINLGRRRVEHHDHAVVSGRLAGENMTGAQRPYYHQSMFWSDLGPDVGYEAIGIVDSSLPTVAVWAKATAKDTPAAAEAASGSTAVRSEMEEAASASGSSKSSKKVKVQDGNVPVNPESFGKGVIFYMRDKKVVGVVMWNVFGRMPVARKIIADAKEHEDLNELAKLFRLHSS